MIVRFPLNFRAVFSFVLLISSAIYTPYTLAQESKYEQALSAYQSLDFIKATEIWTELATQGDTNAQYALGVMEFREETENPNKKQGFKWLKSAAEKDHPIAMFNIGMAYWQGNGVEENKKEALKWWEKSAETGDSNAQYNLGLTYYIGNVVPIDLIAAKKWLGLAVRQNHRGAIRIYSLVAKAANDKTIDTAVIAGTVELNYTATTSQKYWKVKVASDIHLKPKNSSFILNTFPADTPIQIIDTVGNWSKITLPTGMKTFIYSDFIDKEGNYGVITGSGVRIRPKPTTDNTLSPSLGSYKKDDKVRILEHQGEWILIRAPLEIGGWTLSENLQSYQETKKNRNKAWRQLIEKGF